MNSARDRKIRANNKVEQLIKDVFIKRPITNLVETSYGFRACFGLKKDGTPDTQTVLTQYFFRKYPAFDQYQKIHLVVYQK